MATKRRTEGRRISYAIIMADTGISTTTLTRLANDRSTRVAIVTINTLCGYFNAQPGDLFVYVPDNERRPSASPAEVGLRGARYSKKDRLT